MATRGFRKRKNRPRTRPRKKRNPCPEMPHENENATSEIAAECSDGMITKDELAKSSDNA